MERGVGIFVFLLWGLFTSSEKSGFLFFWTLLILYSHPLFCVRVNSFPLPYEISSEDESESESESEDEDEVKTKLELLDELQAYAEDSVDVAKLLHSDDCLVPFLHHVLPNKHAGIRAKGAEVITTMLRNNPTSQQRVIKEKGLKLLLQNFTSDPDATSRTKALGAISSLIQNNKSCIDKFQRESGNEALMNALISSSVCQREVLSVIQYLLHEKKWDCNIVCELGLPYIMLHLRSLLVLAGDDKLKQALQELISAMTQRDDAEVREVADRNTASEKKEDPGPGPPYAATPTVQSNLSSKRRKRR